MIGMICNGQLIGTGTAFVAKTPNGFVLVTNRHNCTGRDQETGQPLHSQGGIPDTLSIIHNKKDQLGCWTERHEPLLYPDGTPRWVEHPKLGPVVDCVALKMTQSNGVDFYAYDFSEPEPRFRICAADIVSVIGFPFGRRSGGAMGIWATGFVATEPAIDHDALPLMLIDCRSRPGQSGSPVIAYRTAGATMVSDSGQAVVFDRECWRLLGIYSGRINSQSDLGRVWKRSAIAEILSAVPPTA
jgi:hypothetical protein